MAFMSLTTIEVSTNLEKKKMGGGISLYSNENITYCIRDDLDYFDSELEMIVVENDKDGFKTNSNVLVGLILEHQTQQYSNLKIVSLIFEILMKRSRKSVNSWLT